jgi:hypothetical protein
MRVPAQPYLRFDRNDYSLDPRLVGRRVEIRVSQAEITARDHRGPPVDHGLPDLPQVVVARGHPGPQARP